MGGYAVDPAELERCDAVLGEAAGRTRAALADVRGCAAALLGARWQGEAAAAFRLGWEQWLDGVGLMLESLDAMAAALGASGGGYAGTEETVRAGIAGAAG